METENLKTLLSNDFLKQFETDFGKESLEKYLASFSLSNVRGLRVNTEKISLESFEKNFKYDIDKINYFDDAYYLNTNEKIGNSCLHRAGAFYLQEPSSMTPVASVKNLDFKNKYILDLCASPGGKSLQIASLMENTGVLISNEIDSKRCFELFTNIERLGIKNAIITNETPQNLKKNFNCCFDYIFVDAPCSGEGMFRKDETAIKEWNENLKYYNSERQLEILSCANTMLKKDGIIVYSTCTFNLIENENVIDKFSKNYGYEILKPCDDILPFVENGKIINDNNSLLNTKHFFPFNNKGEGQFLAILKKQSIIDNTSQQFKTKSIKINNNEEKICREFISNTLNQEVVDIQNLKFEKIGNNINIYTFDSIDTSKLKMLSKGVILGNIEKDRLVPHHQFFMAYGKYFKNQISLKNDCDSIKRYLKGEQLNLKDISESDVDYILKDINGYGVIMCCGATLGGIKIIGDEIKNHYPKALRINNLI